MLCTVKGPTPSIDGPGLLINQSIAQKSIDHTVFHAEKSSTVHIALCAQEFSNQNTSQYRTGVYTSQAVRTRDVLVLV